MKQRGVEWEEYDKAVRWMAMTMIITLTITVFFTIFSLPLSFLLEHGISKENMQSVKMFVNTVFDHPTFLFKQYSRWMHKLSATNEFSISRWVPILPAISLPLGLIVGGVSCP